MLINKNKKLTKEQYENMSIKDLKYVLTLRGRCSKNAVPDMIRQLNRIWNAELTRKKCQNCNYSKCVELAHIKAIANFSENTLLKEINHKDNILSLCRNCHFELDSGLLLLEDIPL
jgi:hypothetical protein